MAEQESQQGLPPLRSVSLVLTSDCNLRCDYCFVQSTGSTPNAAYAQGDMSAATAEAAVRLILNSPCPRKKRFVHFFGGEPLLKAALLQHVVKYARAQAEQVSSSDIGFLLTTNGTLLTEQLCAFLAHEQFIVTVSLDGPESFHDVHRRDSRTRGSYSNTWDGLIRLAKLLPTSDLAVRSTYTRDTASGLRALAKDLGRSGIGRWTIQPCVTPLSNSNAIRLSDVPRIASYFDLLARDYFRGGLRQHGLRVVELEHAFFRSEWYQNKKRYCEAGRTSVAVSANGDVYPCQRMLGLSRYYCGNLHEVSSLSELTRWQAPLAHNMERCSNCGYMKRCGGGCPGNAEERWGHTNEPHDVECSLIKAIVQAVDREVEQMAPEQKSRPEQCRSCERYAGDCPFGTVELKQAAAGEGKCPQYKKEEAESTPYEDWSEHYECFDSPMCFCGAGQ